MSKDQSSSKVVAQSTANAKNRSQELKAWNQYQRKGLSEMRPYIKGEDMTGISVSEVDDPENDMGMVARNPKNHADQWYVARKYFDENLEPVSHPTPVSVEGLQRWESAKDNLVKALEAFEEEHESDPKKVGVLMGRYAMALASAKLVIDSLTPHPDTPEPSGEEWYTELIRLVGDLRDDFCDDNCLNVCDHFDSAPLSIGEKQLAHRWIAMYSKSVFDTSTEESNNDATEFLKGLEPNTVSPPKTEGDRELMDGLHYLDRTSRVRTAISSLPADWAITRLEVEGSYLLDWIDTQLQSESRLKPTAQNKSKAEERG